MTAIDWFLLWWGVGLVSWLGLLELYMRDTGDREPPVLRDFVLAPALGLTGPFMTAALLLAVVLVWRRPGPGWRKGS